MKIPKSSGKVLRGLTGVFAILFGTFMVLTDMGDRYEGFINSALGVTAPTTEGEGEDYYESAYGELNAENCAKLIEDENDFNIRAMQEGAVLLRNENNALPLSSSERSITFFGNSVKSPVYATNAGGSSFKSARGGSIYDAFSNAGFSINDTVYNAICNSSVSRVSSSNQGSSDIGEVDVSFYDSLKSSWANDYNDVAVILLTRYGGEGVDLDSVADADGVPLLSLHQEEEDLLKMIKDSGAFKKTVVLVNSPFPMDVEWIEDSDYGVDACLAFGAAGDTGFIGIANLLTGTTDFSGHLTDTYATDSLSAPAMRNFGDFSYTNHTTKYESDYVVYAEDIYVGYKYYETRYQDQVLGQNNASGNYGVYASSNSSWNYAEEMAYTFGYGLSYTDWDEEVQSIVWDQENHEVTASVKVTNLGNSDNSYSGKSKRAVQLYVQDPWESGQAEKSAIQLLGFAKTGELAVGESETVTITADDYLFAAYDENATNGADTSKKGCYVFDEGDYYFAVGDNAHDALNNVLEVTNPNAELTDEKGNVVEGDSSKVMKQNLAAYDNVTHATSEATGEVVCNQLQEIDYNYYNDGSVTYLTRGDWSTYPISYTDLSVTDQLKTDLDGNSYVNDGSISVDDITTGADNNLMFVDMHDVDYDDDETWDAFLDQLTISNLTAICGETMGNKAITTVNKPYNSNTDGPKGLGSSYTYGDGTGITLYVDQVVMSSTFNLDLCAERGSFFAEDALYSGYTMIFGPGADWHRTAYSGRNSEYYSEDANMSLYCGAAQVKAMQEGGLIAGTKHFAGNDQETNRHGVATYANEQSFREGSLRCFEGALRDDLGGGLGVMTCFNRIGATAGAASYPVQTQILRNEWGFKGVNLTDSSKDASDYVHTEECIVNGTDMFNNDASRTDELVLLIKGGDGIILQAVRTANKHFYYAFSRSNLVNGLAHETAVEDFVPWWKTALNAFDIIFGILAGISLAGFVALYVLGIVNKGKEENGKNIETEESQNG